MGITRERRADLQLKMIESGKSNGWNGKAGKGKEKLLLVDVLLAEWRRKRKDERRQVT